MSPESAFAKKIASMRPVSGPASASAASSASIASPATVASGKRPQRVAAEPMM